MLKKLTRDDVTIAQKGHPQLTPRIGYSCTKQILTCGNHPVFSKTPVVAFFNEQHTDFIDWL